MPSTPGKAAGSGKAAGTAAPGPPAAGRGWEEPGIHWLHTVRGAIGSAAALQENVICWENLGGRCPSLSLGRGGTQEHGPARGGMRGRGRATLVTPGPVCHLQPGRARGGLAWAPGFPGKWENRDFSPAGGSRRFPARCITPRHTRHKYLTLLTTLLISN